MRRCCSVPNDDVHQSDMYILACFSVNLVSRFFVSTSSSSTFNDVSPSNGGFAARFIGYYEHLLYGKTNIYISAGQFPHGRLPRPIFSTTGTFALKHLCSRVQRAEVLESESPSISVFDSLMCKMSHYIEHCSNFHEIRYLPTSAVLITQCNGHCSRRLLFRPVRPR